MAIGQQAPAHELPPLRYKRINSFTWGAGGNTRTISDEYIAPNSIFEWWVTGTTPQAGQWALNITKGQVVITSSDSESSGLTVSYVVL